MTRTCQEMEEKYGRPFGVLEGYAIHAGASRAEVANIENKDMPEITNPRAQEYMEQYRDGMIEKNGEDVDWLHGEFDSQVTYDCTGGKPHGRFAIADGAFDSESVQLTSTAGATSEFQRAKRQREDNDIDRRMQERERAIVERMEQRQMEIITQVCEEARQEIERANRESNARHEQQMRQMFSYFQLCQAPQNSNEATLQRTGGSSFGYTQAAHNITENGISPPTRRTISANNENMTTGEVEDTSEANGHVDSFLELLRSST